VWAEVCTSSATRMPAQLSPQLPTGARLGRLLDSVRPVQHDSVMVQKATATVMDNLDGGTNAESVELPQLRLLDLPDSEPISI
jgi:hypothetical protein